MNALKELSTSYKECRKGAWCGNREIQKKAAEQV